jgi:glycosyltransferase involved in cell wall biosynthesis
MISFIVIGRNESIKIYNCIKSISDYIIVNNIEKNEIIYVDSDSIDDSIEMAKMFKNIKTIKLVGNINAAVARNAGAEIAKGEYLFFIDGDMEVSSSFYKIVFNKFGKLIYDFVSGEFISYHYENGELVSTEAYHKIKEDTFEPITGGIFLIKKTLWVKMNGMNPKYRRCQDLDFGLRMSQNGFKLLRKKEIIAIHHTISYYETKRLWSDLFNLNQLYQKSVLYRDHFFNPYIWRYIKREISFFSLITSLILFFIFYNYFLLLLFPVSVLIKSLYKNKNGVSKNLFISYSYYFLLDIFVFFGFLFFWPKRNKIYKVEYQF